MSWIEHELSSDDTPVWAWTADDTRHLVVLVGEELREYHEQTDGPPTVHVYRRLDGWAQRGADVGPLMHAQYVRTATVGGGFAPWWRTLSDFEVCDHLVTEAYDKATG